MSGVFEPGNTVDGLHELAPTVALRLQDLFAFSSKPVITASSLPRLFDPASLDPTALLKAIKQRIKRSNIEAQPATRTLFDERADVITMTRLRLEQRQNQQLRTPLLQLPIQHSRTYICHSDILRSPISRVNSTDRKSTR